MHPCGSISTSAIHFIISKMVSAVRADATEVPTSRHKTSSTNGLPATGPQSGSKFKKKIFGNKLFASTTTRKIRWIHWWNPFSNPLTITGDICNFVTAMSALSNTPQCSVYNYARRPILRTGLRSVQLFLVLLFFYSTLRWLILLYRHWFSNFNSVQCATRNAWEFFCNLRYILSII